MAPSPTPPGIKPRYTSRTLFEGSMSPKDPVGGDPVSRVSGLVSSPQRGLEPDVLGPRKLQGG